MKNLRRIPKSRSYRKLQEQIYVIQFNYASKILIKDNYS